MCPSVLIEVVEGLTHLWMVVTAEISLADQSRVTVPE